MKNDPRLAELDVEPLVALEAWRRYRLDRILGNDPTLPPEVEDLLDRALIYADALRASGESPANVAGGPNTHAARMFGFGHAPGETHLLMQHHRMMRTMPVVLEYMDNDCNAYATEKALGITKDRLKDLLPTRARAALRKALHETPSDKK